MLAKTPTISMQLEVYNLYQVVRVQFDFYHNCLLFFIPNPFQSLAFILGLSFTYLFIHEFNMTFYFILQQQHQISSQLPSNQTTHSTTNLMQTPALPVSHRPIISIPPPSSSPFQDSFAGNIIRGLSWAWYRGACAFLRSEAPRTRQMYVFSRRDPKYAKFLQHLGG